MIKIIMKVRHKAASGANDELNFVKQIGRLGEPPETQLVVEMAHNAWEIWPQLSATDPQTGRTVAETNVRTALSLINLPGEDKTLNREQLLLAALTKNLSWGGRGVN